MKKALSILIASGMLGATSVYAAESTAYPPTRTGSSINDETVPSTRSDDQSATDPETTTSHRAKMKRHAQGTTTEEMGTDSGVSPARSKTEDRTSR